MSKLVYRVCKFAPNASPRGMIFVVVERHAKKARGGGIVVSVFNVLGKYLVDWKLDETLYKYDAVLTSPDKVYDSLRDGLNSREMSRCLRRLK